MADFCKQCSIEMFGEDMGDLKGVSNTPLTEEDNAKGFGWAVICEGCGNALVDDEGKCIAEHCLKKHGVATDEP